MGADRLPLIECKQRQAVVAGLRQRFADNLPGLVRYLVGYGQAFLVLDVLNPCHRKAIPLSRYMPYPIQEPADIFHPGIRLTILRPVLT